MTDEAIQDILYLLGAWERGADAEEYVNEIEALRQSLQRPVKSYTNGEPQYATEDMSTKPQNVYTSEERVHESDKSIHDLRAAAEMALVALDHTARSAVEQYVIEQQVVTFLKQALAQPEQEPVTLESVYETIIHWDESGGKRSRRELARRIAKLYTAPPSKPWVSLTDEDVFQIANKCRWSDTYHNDFARAIEAKLKEKNHV